MSKVKPGAGRKMWIKALRSGKYKQGRGSLRVPESNSYCCLGVACDVFSQAKSRGGEFINYGTRFETDDGLSSVGYLVNQKVAEWVGITRDDVDRLATMNDTDEKSFNEIADYVESLPV